VLSFLLDLEFSCIETGIVTQEQQQLLREHLGRAADTLLSELSNSAFGDQIRIRTFLRGLSGETLIRWAADFGKRKSSPNKLATVIPDQRADSLLRYQAFYSREADRAMAELERLQRRRLGEAVPPPINVNLSAAT
jgi:hypothetical protein